MKHPKEFTVEEVGLWLLAIGLGSKIEAFAASAVDGARTTTSSIFDERRIA